MLMHDLPPCLVIAAPLKTKPLRELDLQKTAYDLLKAGQPAAAMPFIELLLISSKDRADWQRWCYCAAQAALAAGDLEGSCHRFQCLYEADAQGRFAQEAFFHSYPLASYLKGDKRALKQLEELLERYPSGLYSIYACYLLAKQQGDKADKTPLRKSSLKALEKAYNYYRRACGLAECELKASIAERQQALIWLEWQSLFQAAECAFLLSQSPLLLKRGRWQKRASMMIEKLLNLVDVQQKQIESWSYELKLRSMGLQTALYCQNRQWQQAEELLGKMFEACGSSRQQDQGVGRRCCLEAIVELCQSSITSHEGAYAGRWLEKGAYLLKSMPYEEAALAFLLQRARYLEMGGYDDEAMCTVVKVINSPVASSLRLKAMFYQAELFRKAGKEEQACRAKERAQALVGRCLVEEFEGFFRVKRR